MAVGALVFGLILGMTVSIAVGMAGAFSLSLLNWLAFAVVLPLINEPIGKTLAGLLLGVLSADRHDALVVGIAYAIAIAVVAGLIGGVAASLARYEERPLAGQWSGAVIVAMLVNSAIYALTIGVFKSGAINVAISILCCIGLSPRPLPRRSRLAIGGAAACGLIYFSLIGAAHALVAGTGSTSFGSTASVVTGTMWLACFFALPAVVARRSAAAQAPAPWAWA